MIFYFLTKYMFTEFEFFFSLERVLQVERLGLDTIKVGFVYNIVLCRKSVIGAEQTWDRANGQDLHFSL